MALQVLSDGVAAQIQLDQVGQGNQTWLDSSEKEPLHAR